jgi:Cu+-exporting ATPase
MKTEVFDVKGMSCASCAVRIEKTVRGLSGVQKADINFATEKLTLNFDESVVKQNDIEAAVKKIGYELITGDTDNGDNAGSNGYRQATIPIAGMTCASCSARIEKTLKNLPGVESASVNLATEKAEVSYQPAQIRLFEIKEAITRIGYTPLDEAQAADVDENQKRKDREFRGLRNSFLLALSFTLPLLYLAMAPMLSFISLPFPEFLAPMVNPLLYALTAFTLVIPAVIAGRRFYTVGLKSLFAAAPNMDSLIAIGTLAALGYSIFSTVKIILGDLEAVGQLYFETAAVILTLILLGKTLEALSKGRASLAIRKLLNLAPKTAIIVKGSEEKMIPAGELERFDLVRVRPGERIATDGVVIDGYTAVDESMLTGESIPVEKKQGDAVIGGSLNKNGTIIFRAEKIGKETALARIIKLVEEAQGSKAPIARLADIVSGYFVPIVMGIALVTGVLWLIAGKDFPFALMTFTTVLVIACPCALGLATPTAVMVGTGRGAALGILFKSGPALEMASRINIIVFDKTGTLTVGKPEVASIVPAGVPAGEPEGAFSESEILAYAGSAEKNSEHPLADAVVNRAARDGIQLPGAQSFMAVPGKGIQAVVGGKKILLGKAAFLEEAGVSVQTAKDTAAGLAEDGNTILFLSVDGVYAGLIACSDVLKTDAVEAIAELAALGIATVMLTGDNERAAGAIAARAGITRVCAEVLPDGKAEVIRELKDRNHRVAMVGDGINDAPALAAADIGIAIGTGTDVAIESADVVLTKDNLTDIAKAIRLSKRTLRNIRQNLFWAFCYNVLGIPVAAGLLTLFGGPLLSPVIAAGAMSLSSVSVVSNALRLKRFR